MAARTLAAAVLALESLGVLALVGWQIVALTAGDTGSAVSAVALAVLTLAGAGALIAFSIGTARDLSWGRSGGIVVQVLILAVAFGALTGVGANPLIAGALALPAVIGLVVLLRAVAQAAPPASRDEP